MENGISEIYIELILSILTLGSISIFVIWLLKTYFGLAALKNAPVKRMDIELHVPFFIMFCWLAVSSLGGFAAAKFTNDESLVIYFIRLGISLTFSIICLIVAKHHFVRGIRGLGLNFRTLHKDLWWGFVNLFTIWPFMILGLKIILLLGKYFIGEDFELTRHQSLETIAANKDIFKLVVMIVLIAIVTPFFEEILFRGIIQSTINSYINSPWIAIFISSALFTVLHPPQHWLAIFALSSCMGYSYQKSGSLLRPIIIHAMFNTANTVTALLVSI